MPSKSSRWEWRHSEAGQVLALFVIGLLALIAGVAVVIDGGNAFANQRVTQNAADAAADAGATVLVQNVAVQVAGTLPKSDADVLSAVNSMATQNGMSTPTAYYTTVSGRCILGDQSTAAPPCNAVSGAVQVGSGAIPNVAPDAAGKPQCPVPYYSDSAGHVTTSAVASACGVAVFGSRQFHTFFAGAIGISQFDASATATAVAGAQTTICPAGSPCGFLPVTFPGSMTACGSTNKYDFLHNLPYLVIPSGDPLTVSNESIIQICGSGPGSVGWLAIQPEDGNNGVADLGNDIVTPDNPPLFLPLWINSQTGNTNAVESAVNTYAGQIPTVYEPGQDQQVTIPLYDCTADVSVVGGQQNPATSPAECSGLTPAQLDGGTGSNLYYHIPAIAGFVLDHAYIQGGNQDKKACNPPPTGTSPIANVIAGGNGATGCLTGWFVSVSSPNVAVGTGSGTPTSAFGIQLIR